MHKLAPNVLFKDMGEEGILLNPMTSSYYRLNPLGNRILSILIKENTSTTKDQIKLFSEQIAAETGILLSEVQEDIDHFLNKLQEAKILVTA